MKQYIFGMQPNFTKSMQLFKFYCILYKYIYCIYKNKLNIFYYCLIIAGSESGLVLIEIDNAL